MRGKKHTLLTFNQVVPGSIPGAPSSNFKVLAENGWGLLLFKVTTEVTPALKRGSRIIIRVSRV